MSELTDDDLYDRLIGLLDFWGMDNNRLVLCPENGAFRAKISTRSHSKGDDLEDFCTHLDLACTWNDDDECVITRRPSGSQPPALHPSPADIIAPVADIFNGQPPRLGSHLEVLEEEDVLVEAPYAGMTHVYITERRQFTVPYEVMRVEGQDVTLRHRVANTFFLYPLSWLGPRTISVSYVYQAN